MSIHSFLYRAEMAQKGREGFYLTDIEKKYLPMVQAQAEMIKTISMANKKQIYQDTKKALYDLKNYQVGTNPDELEKALDAFFSWIEQPSNDDCRLILVLDLIKERDTPGTNIFPFDKMTDDAHGMVLDLIQVRNSVQDE